MKRPRRILFALIDRLRAAKNFCKASAIKTPLSRHAIHIHRKGASSLPVQIGETAPDFTVKDQHGRDIRLADFKGKRVLLSWHPLAWTPVCTDQMRALEANFDTFQKLNTIPLGFSVDPQPTKKAWAAALRIEQVSLPSDFWPHGGVAQAYGIFNTQDGASERANIIVDENGRVEWVKVYPSGQLPDLNEVFQVLKKQPSPV